MKHTVIGYINAARQQWIENSVSQPRHLQSQPHLSNDATSQSGGGFGCKRRAVSRGSSDSISPKSLGQRRHVKAAPLNLSNQSVQNGPLCFQWNHLPVRIEHQALKESASCAFQSVHRFWRTKTAQNSSYQTTVSIFYTWKENVSPAGKKKKYSAPVWPNWSCSGGIFWFGR